MGHQHITVLGLRCFSCIAHQNELSPFNKTKPNHFINYSGLTKFPFSYIKHKKGNVYKYTNSNKQITFTMKQ